MEQVFQVIRSRVCDPLPHQVREIVTFYNRQAALVVAEGWQDLPAVQEGREKVRVIEHWA